MIVPPSIAEIRHFFFFSFSSSKPSGDFFSGPTWSSVHCAGSLSGLHLRNFVPWRNLPLVKWSYSTSTTSFGASGFHSADRFVLHLLGPPGACPVNPGGFMSFSSFG